MTRSRLYVARDAKVTIVSRARLRMPGGRLVRRSWGALVETTASALQPGEHRSLPQATLVVVPPAVVGVLTGVLGSVEGGFLAAGGVFFGMSYLMPLLRRRTAEGASRRSLSRLAAQGHPTGRARRWSGRLTGAAEPGSPAADQLGGGSPAADRLGGRGRSTGGTERWSAGRLTRPGATADSAAAVVLSDAAERAAFAAAVATADRITETWPRLGALIDVADAEGLLAEALWEIAAVQARRQELTGVLGRLSHPDFAARSPDDETAHTVHAHRQATKLALSNLEIELARRLASLRRAEQAGQAFIREEEMRSAIRAAEESLRASRPPELSAAQPADPGAELADHTRSVLDAYRELTAGLHPDPPA